MSTDEPVDAAPKRRRPEAASIEMKLYGAHIYLRGGVDAQALKSVLGITTRPDGSWMLQMARNETDLQVGALSATRYLILDRDTKYTEQFRRLIRESGTAISHIRVLARLGITKRRNDRGRLNMRRPLLF